ncbi:MAG: PilZ domain-containing protein [Vicinamibacterales bacterium]
MTVREISRSGVLVETVFPLQLDSLHEIRLTLGDCSIVAKARVAHCRIGEIDQERVSYRSGMEFIELNTRVQQVIDRFIDAVEADRRARPV